jgi:hypothetical protein
MLRKMRYHTQRAHYAPERCQLPEHYSGDKDNLGHCSWGATVDTIGRSQVCTAKKDGIVPPNSRPPLWRTGSHERARESDENQWAEIGIGLTLTFSAPFILPYSSVLCAVVIYAEVAESSATLLTSRIVSPSVNQTFHSFSSLAPIPIPTGR